MANYRAPSLRLVTHHPGWRWLLVGGAVSACIAALLIGYYLGRNQILQSRVDAGVLQVKLDTEKQQRLAAQGRQAELEIEWQMQRDALQSLRGELKQQHGEVTRLKEEVTFYKSLMAPNEVQQGLSVQELELRDAGAPGRFEFELLLTQVAVRRAFIGGNVRMDIEGYSQSEGHSDAEADNGTAALGGADGAPKVVKSLTEMAPDLAYPLKFRFRYFQDLQGSFELPPGFTPSAVLVTARQNGKEPLQVRFPWPE